MRDTLTPQEVEAIRTLANTPGITYQSVATQYDVPIEHVRFIANNQKEYNRGKK